MRILKALAVLLLLTGSARAGYYGSSGGLAKHGHSSDVDGGRITNLNLIGAIQATTATFQALSLSTPMAYTWSTIATATVQGMTFYQFKVGDLIGNSVLGSSATYRLTYGVLFTQSGAPRLRLNNDSTVNYYAGNMSMSYAGSVLTYSGNMDFFPLTGYGGIPTIAANWGTGGTLTFSTVAGNSRQWFLTGNFSAVGNDGATVPQGGPISGYYAASADLSSIEFICTFACNAHFVLEKFNNAW